MGSELTILAIYGLLLGVIIGVQVVLAIPNLGFNYLLGPRDEGKKTDGMAGRCERAMMNSVYAMVLFAPAILVLALKDGFTGTSLLCAQVFLIARILYVPVYLAGVPWVRTGVWAAGFAATMILFLLGL